MSLWVSIYFPFIKLTMAERLFLILAVSVGFEPTARITTNSTLAGCRFKPLIQLTIFLYCLTNTTKIIYICLHNTGAPDEIRTRKSMVSKTIRCTVSTSHRGVLFDIYVLVYE